MTDEVDSAIAFHTRRHRPPSLHPNVSRRYPLGTSPNRKRLALALFLCATAAGLVIVPRPFQLWLDEVHAKAAITKQTIDAYAYQAFPAWRLVRSGACPWNIAELNAFLGRTDANDAWGMPLSMYCATTRSGAHAIVVRSAGEDMTLGTADDLWSDR